MTAVGIPSQRNCRYNTPSLPDLFVAQETEREFEQGLRIEFSLPPEMLCLVLSNNGEKIRKVGHEKHDKKHERNANVGNQSEQI